jgi:hypothetical protein
MINWLADVGPCAEESAEALLKAWTHHNIDGATRVVGNNSGGVVRLGIDGDAAHIRLSDTRLVMQCVASNIRDRDARLVWTFSAVEIEIGDLQGLIEEWREADQPPVLSIVALNLGKHQHTIGGAEAFIGHQLSAEFSNPASSRDAARNLAILARHAMVTGTLDRHAIYEGVDRRVLTLKWSSDAESPAMVTIVL